jgi:hypothetical protein
MVLSVQAAHSQDASVSVAHAKANLSRMLAGDMYQMVRAKLANSGLAPQDVDRAAQIWTDGVASCAVDALASDSDPKAMQILKALSSSETEVELNERLPEIDPEDDDRYFESLKPKLEECFSSVVQDAGIVR